jgi:hypothetical protein
VTASGRTVSDLAELTAQAAQIAPGWPPTAVEPGDRHQAVPVPAHRHIPPWRGLSRAKHHLPHLAQPRPIRRLTHRCAALSPPGCAFQLAARTVTGHLVVVRVAPSSNTKSRSGGLFARTTRDSNVTEADIRGSLVRGRDPNKRCSVIAPRRPLHANARPGYLPYSARILLRP